MMPVAMSPDGTTMLPGDEKLMVRFSLMEIENEYKSKEAGMPKYDDIEMVEIIIPGCRDNCIRKASDEDKRRFKRQYEAFLITKGEAKEGTPLNHFPFIGPSQRRELEYFNIYTAEGLVGLTDGYLENIPMDLRPLIQRVKTYMDLAKDSALALKHASENQELKDEIDMLKSQIKDITSTLKSKDIDHGNLKDEVNPDLKHKHPRKPGGASNINSGSTYQNGTA
jgi:hypothetical protein